MVHRDFFFGTHYSHVNGIGSFGLSKGRVVSQGLVGQIEARKAVKILLNIFERQDFQGGGVIITGSNGTGKNTLIKALSTSITIKNLFLTANGAEIYSPTLSKTEILTQLTRRAIGVTFFQETIFINGQVVNFQIYKNSMVGSKYKNGKITLKTKDFQCVYEIGSKVLKKLIDKKIRPGDFITINRGNGEIKKKKNSFLNEKELIHTLDKQKNSPLEIENYVVTEHLVTFHELDVLNHFGDLISNFFLVSGVEIPANIRERIDKIVLDWIREGKIKLTRGILYINDTHILDSESFSFLGKNFENFLSPFFIFATSEIENKLNTLNSISFHGLPLDFSDRLLMIPMKPNTEKEIKEILKLRMKKNSIFLEENSLMILTKIALECGICYSIYIMTISFSFQKEPTKKKIGRAHV